MRNTKFFKSYTFLLIMFWALMGSAQDCQSEFTIVLKNIRGGVYANQTITMTSRADGKVFQKKSDAKGEATFSLPCNTTFDLAVSNYTKAKEVKTGEFNGAKSMRTLSYEPDMVEKDKLFAMTPEEQKMVDAGIAKLPDTTLVKNSVMPMPLSKEFYASTEITIKDIEGNPLAGEWVVISGVKRGKNFKACTALNGLIKLWLPKGDTYTLNFKHNKNYATIDIEYSLGTSDMTLSYSYLGTKEIERRKKIEEERIAAEEKRLKEEEAKFLAYCKKKGITPEEGRRREAEEYLKSLSSFSDTVINAVFSRNRWDDKLIVCDLTGSMSPYVAQLSLWYQLHFQKEKNLQFVFFNDGDNQQDHLKKIGETGGIYYARSEGIEALAAIMAKVAGNGSGGDCPENNMEALIKGTQMASPFKELVMIVDNHAPVKDIQLLTKFKVPVHIILCGVDDWVMLDYLLIAWKTKGSVHTIEQDIYSMASMSEGSEVVIHGITYRIMGGEFVRITKM